MPELQVPLLDFQSVLSSETDASSSGRSSAPSSSNSRNSYTGNSRNDPLNKNLRKKFKANNQFVSSSETFRKKVAKLPQNSFNVSCYKIVSHPIAKTKENSWRSIHIKHKEEIFEKIEKLNKNSVNLEEIEEFSGQEECEINQNQVADTSNNLNLDFVSSETSELLLTNRTEDQEFSCSSGIHIEDNFEINKYQKAGTFFRERKAISQIDCAAARKAVTFFVGFEEMPDCNMEALRKANDNKESFWCLMNYMMLNSYRKRRAEAKKLGEEIEALKIANKRLDNKANNMRIVLTNEQRRSDGLSSKQYTLKMENEKLKKNAQTLHKKLKDAELKAEILQSKINEMDTELFDLRSKNLEALEQQFLIEAKLAAEEQQNKSLSYENLILKDDMIKNDDTIVFLKQQQKEMLNIKDKMYEKAAVEIARVERELLMKKDTIARLEQSQDEYKETVCIMQNEIDILQKNFNILIGEKLRRFWTTAKEIQRGSFFWLHWLAFYMLPATPPPRQSGGSLPFGLTLEKAINIIHR